MDKSFWNQRWQSNEINFHLHGENPLLVKHLRNFSLQKGSRIFLPLCGKTRDIGWLLAIGHRIVGAELIEIAVVQLFLDLGIEPQITNRGELKHYSAKNIDIFVGDIFNVTQEILGPVDLVYDRAALVALPQEVRKLYATHLIEITKKAPQLLITFEYDQSKIQGPPFSISVEEVNRHYQLNGAELRPVESVEVLGGLKGKCPAREMVWELFIQE